MMVSSLSSMVLNAISIVSVTFEKEFALAAIEGLSGELSELQKSAQKSSGNL